MMRFRMIVISVALCMLTIFVACLGVAVSTEALASQPRSLFQTATQHGSVTGTISAVGDATFSVEVKKSQNPVTLQFSIDDATKFSGRLQVGSTATVDYRTDAGNNIAERVVVQSRTAPR
jgi:hypothetical protein